MKWDLNCDLGEGESPRVTRALMRSVTSANIACGGHGGNLQSMEFAVRAALEHRVRIGAHPGLTDPEGFGRRPGNISPAELETLLLQQISAIEKIAATAGSKLHHVKLHGALYHLAEADPDLRAACVRTVARFWPRLVLFALAGGKLASAAGGAGLTVWPEGFLDRNYLPNGSLVPRTNSNAPLDRRPFRQRLEAIVCGESPVRAPVRTWCVHSDTPNALEFARLARARFSAKRKAPRN